MVDMEDFPIATTLAEAAQHILDHSFAIYRVSDELTEKIRSAHYSAVAFFGHVETEEGSGGAAEGPNGNDDPSSLYRRIVNGNLYGYNVPSPAKRLFRAYCFSPHQPWPGNTRFRHNSTSLAEDLHFLLVQCTRNIMKKYSSRPTSSSSSTRTSSSPPRKRPRMTNGDAPTVLEDSDAVEKMMMSLFSSSANAHKDDMPCPLDYFFYHNHHPSLVNCSEHVDRGVLIVVCLTNVPGLEVLPSSMRSNQDGNDSNMMSHTFVCPEVLVHNENLYREVDDPCSNLVCIMAGDQLARLLSTLKEVMDTVSRNEDPGNGREPKENEGQRDGDLPMACLHRVRSHLKLARLSISYELRL